MIRQPRSQDDRKVRPAVKADLHFAPFDPDIGGHVNDVSKDVAGLGVGIAPHPPREHPVQAAGDDEQGHVEIYLQADR